MRKPRYITLAGWLTLALVALGAWAWFTGRVAPPERKAFAAGCAYTLAVTGFFVLWAGGTARTRAADRARLELARKLYESDAFKALRKIDLTGATREGK